MTKTLAPHQTIPEAAPQTFGELAERNGFTGSYRLTVCKKRAGREDERSPDQIWGMPTHETERLRICADFGYDPDRGLPSIYFVSALSKGVAGRDMKCMLKPSKSGRSITAFPIDFYLLGENMWNPRTELTKIDLVFSKGKDQGWSAIHPLTGQRIIALSREEKWQVTPSEEDPDVSIKYAAGTLGMRFAASTGVLISGPYKIIKMATEGALVAAEEGSAPPSWVTYTIEPAFTLGNQVVPLFRLVGNVLEMTDRNLADLRGDIDRFRKTLLGAIHPDLMQGMNKDDESVERLEALRTCEERFKQIDEELIRLDAWVVGWFDYRRQLKEDASVFAAAGAPIPTAKLHPAPLGEMKLPSIIAKGKPLAFRTIEEITKALFSPEKKARRKTDKKVVNGGQKTTRTTTAKPTAKATTKPAEPKSKATSGAKGTTKATPSAPAPTTNGKGKNGNGHPAAPIGTHSRMTSVADNLDAETKAKLDEIANHNGGDTPPPTDTLTPVEQKKTGNDSFRFVTCDECKKKRKVAADYVGNTIDKCAECSKPKKGKKQTKPLLRPSGVMPGSSYDIETKADALLDGMRSAWPP